MPLRQRKDYNELLKKSQELIASGEAKSITDLSRALNIQRSSLMNLFERNFGITTFDQIKGARTKSDAPADPSRRDMIGPEHADEFEVEIDGNEGVIRSLTVENQITTIAQLLKKTGVGDEYIVHNPRVKKWDVVLKVKVDKDRENISVVPSIYIEAPLRRKNPIVFEPIIRPIEIELPKLPKPGKQAKNGVRRALIINDPQIGFRRRLHTTELIPFHDRRVLDLALQICQEEEIHHISLGGDVDDLSEWSNKFLAEPEFYWTTQPALLETSWWLTQLRLARPHAEIKMLEGNHDLRMPLLVVSNLKQAYRLKAVDELELPAQMTVPRLLALHKLNVEYVSGYPNNGYWLNKNIRIEHGDVVRGTPGATAAAVTTRQAYTTIFGHIHRREMVSKRIKLNEGMDQIYTAFCPGCACHIDGRVPGSSPKDQWQQGLAVVEYTDDYENITPIAINDGKMIYKERLWTARDRETEINKFLQDTLEGISG